MQLPYQVPPVQRMGIGAPVSQASVWPSDMAESSGQDGAAGIVPSAWQDCYSLPYAAQEMCLDMSD
jgi:hypothetical protein